MSAEAFDSGVGVAGDSPASDDASMQYLTFLIADEVYGIPIAHVAEIIGAQRFTAVPDPRPFMKGVTNLRGTVIPVMDVRIRLAMKPREVDERTCIVVVQLDDTVVGLLIDTISEVVEVAPAAIEAVPRRKTASIRESIVMGLAQIDEEVKILIDLRRLLFGSEDPAGGNHEER